MIFSIHQFAPTKIYPLSTILHWIFQKIKDNHLQTSLNIINGICIVILNLAFVWTTKLAIDIATGQIHSVTLLTAGLLLIVIIFFQISLSFVNKWIRAVWGVKARNQMQRKIFVHMLFCEWNHVEKYHSGDIMNRIEKDVTTIISFVTESIPSFITVIIQFTGAFIFLFLMDKMLACIIVLIGPIFIIINKIYFNKMHNLTLDVCQSDSKVQAFIQECIQHHTIIKTLEQNNILTSNLCLIQETMQKQVRKRTKFSALSSTIINSGFAASYLFTFLWGTYHLQMGTISYGTLIAFIQLVGQIQGPVRNLSKFIPNIINSITAAERILELEDLPREQLIEHKKLTGSLGIRLKNVSYSYIKKKSIFKHFSYDFIPGTTTAIMGKTGSGKTTLIRLILSLIKSQEGSVEIYNNKETIFSSPATRKYISYVPQGNTLLSGTIKDNLLLGNSHASDDDIKKALHYAAADFVMKLPNGINTLCGEFGYGLSEGQAQRICIARALLRPCQILLLDEATSALDILTEKEVLQTISSEIKDKTIIVVSHQKNILEYCSNVLRL